jgi:exodeoxyribonuclease VII large subunit
LPEEVNDSLEIQVYTVSGITAEIRELIEGTFPPVWVEGEISNFNLHSSGHMYFSLKDEGASLRCVFFRQNNFRLRFKPENGMKVLAFGELTVYEPSGQYQLKIAELRPVGIGELQLAFEQLKARLQAEGLFDQERKRPIPSFPAVVAVVTSPTGAAVRDIISVISRRCPPVRIVIYPVRVQGEGAAAEIAGGIRAIGQWGGADVVITGRGGGSIEDLWAFNEEVVARAIAECPVPVISAVGHETDFTIADFVADLRAPTPSAAAEFAVPEAAELLARLKELANRLLRSQQNRLEYGWQMFDSLERGLSPGRLLERYKYLKSQQDSLARRLYRVISTILEAGSARWEGLRHQLAALNPAAVLDRGFSLARTPAGEIVRNARQVAVNDNLELILSSGLLGCRVETVQPDVEKLKVPGLPGRLHPVRAEKKSRRGK